MAPGDYSQAIDIAINAGIDMVMVPNAYRDFIARLKALVAAGRVPQARIDDAVRRILKQKVRFKLWEKPFTDRALTAEIGSPAHREVARDAVRKSLVVLKNDKQTLPLKNDARVHVCGLRADNMGVQCGGWSVGWRGRRGDITPGTTIRKAIEKVVGAATHRLLRERRGRREGRRGGGRWSARIRTPRAAATAPSWSSARRTWRWSTPRSAAASRSWSCCSRGGRSSWATCWTRRARWSPPGCRGPRATGVADVLFGAYKPTGKLPCSWPANMSQIPINVGDPRAAPLFPFGLRPVLVSARVAALFAMVALGAGGEPKMASAMTTPTTTAPATTRTHAPIASGWTFRKVAHKGGPQQVEEAWLPATVPGCVHTDLLAAGKIGDPFYRLNEKDQQWIENEAWEYRTTLPVDAATLARERVELVFAGLDTFAEVFVNGAPVLTADNMFRSWRADVKAKLKAGDNADPRALRVADRAVKPAYDKLGYKLPAANDQGKEMVSMWARKAPYHYGWDWGPRFVTSGIWRPVALEAWDEARLDDVQVFQNKLDAGKARGAGDRRARGRGARRERARDRRAAGRADAGPRRRRR